MSEEIRPALSAEEWEYEIGPGARRLLTRLQWAASEVGRDDTLSIPALAALALQHAGPDGTPMFTWETVDALEQIVVSWADYIEDRALGDERKAALRDVATAKVALAAIASLLPPRTL